MVQPAVQVSLKSRQKEQRVIYIYNVFSGFMVPAMKPWGLEMQVDSLGLRGTLVYLLWGAPGEGLDIDFYGHWFYAKMKSKKNIHEEYIIYKKFFLIATEKLYSLVI